MSKARELEHINALLEDWRYLKKGTDHEFMVQYLDRDRNNDPEWLQEMHGYWGTDKRKTFLKEKSIYHDESGN